MLKCPRCGDSRRPISRPFRLGLQSEFAGFGRQVTGRNLQSLRLSVVGNRPRRSSSHRLIKDGWKIKFRRFGVHRRYSPAMAFCLVIRSRPAQQNGSGSCLIHDVERCFGGSPEMCKSRTSHHFADSCFAGLCSQAESDLLRSGAGRAEERRE